MDYVCNNILDFIEFKMFFESGNVSRIIWLELFQNAPFFFFKIENLILGFFTHKLLLQIQKPLIGGFFHFIYNSI